MEISLFSQCCNQKKSNNLWLQFQDKTTSFSQLNYRLRPGDIQIVAALGDALVSAQGALSTGITTSGKKYRGVSFATGMSKLLLSLYEKNSIY